MEALLGSLVREVESNIGLDSLDYEYAFDYSSRLHGRPALSLFILNHRRTFVSNFGAREVYGYRSGLSHEYMAALARNSTLLSKVKLSSPFSGMPLRGKLRLAEPL